MVGHWDESGYYIGHNEFVEQRGILWTTSDHELAVSVSPGPDGVLTWIDIVTWDWKWMNTPWGKRRLWWYMGSTYPNGFYADSYGDIWGEEIPTIF